MILCLQFGEELLKILFYDAKFLKILKLLVNFNKNRTFCTPFKSPQFGSFLSFPHLAYLLFLNRVRKSVQPGFETYNCVSSETVPWLFVNTILYLPSSFDLMLRMQSVTVLVSPSV